MDMPHFIDVVGSLTVDEIRGCASRVRDADCVADEVAWWRTILVVEQALRARGRNRAAGVAASQAAGAVRAAAERGGAWLPDPEVTCVARAAAGVARALVADVERTHLTLLFRPWGLTPDGADRARPVVATPPEAAVA